MPSSPFHLQAVERKNTSSPSPASASMASGLLSFFPDHNPANLFPSFSRYGSPYIELSETSYIIGGGYISHIEYKGKGYFSGKSHVFKATVTSAPGHGGSLSTEKLIEGTWHTNSKYTKGNGISSLTTRTHLGVFCRRAPECGRVFP